MTAPPLAALSVQGVDVNEVEAIVAGAVVFIVFAVAARLTAPIAARALLRRQLRPHQVAVAGRVVTFVLIGLGAVFAVSFAIQSANVALFGIVLATIIASFGVQDLLKDYVSGYYVLLERHIRVGDRISVELWSGTVSEVRLRVTLLRTDGGDLVVVPNSELFGKPVVVRAKSTEEPPHETASEEARPETPG